MASKTFLQVANPEDIKGTSSWLKQAIRAAINLVVGIDAFKSSYKGAPSVREAIAIASGLTPEQLDTKLRVSGKDPNVWYDTVQSSLGTDISGQTVDEINAKLAAADTVAADPMQQMWLWAGIGLLVLLGGVGGRSYLKGTRRGSQQSRYWHAKRFLYGTFNPRIRRKIRNARMRGR